MNNNETITKMEFEAPEVEVVTIDTDVISTSIGGGFLGEDDSF